MAIQTSIVLFCWTLALLVAAGILSGKLPVLYRGGPRSPFIVGGAFLALHVAGLFGVLGPAEAAALTFGPLLGAGGIALGVKVLRDPGPTPADLVGSSFAAGPLASLGTLLFGIGIGMLLGATLFMTLDDDRMVTYFAGGVILLGALIRLASTLTMENKEEASA